jgi:hypothetical protein
MKFRPLIVMFIIFIFLGICLKVHVAKGELFQLKKIYSVIEEDKIKEYTAIELLEKERAKIFIINFLKASFDKKYYMITKKYKKILDSPDSLKKVFDKESYTKIDFIKIDLFNKENPSHITLRANVYWFMEGYDGVTTFYFMLVKVKDELLLDWLIH